MSRPTRILAAVLTTALLTTACDNTTTTPPATSPTTAASTPAPSTPPKPTVAEPVLPAAAKGITVSSADAFARFYLQVIDYATATGQVGLLNRSSDKGCISCGQLSKLYGSIYKAGGSVTGDFRSNNVAISGVRLTGTKAAVVTLRSTAGRHIVKHSATAKPTTYTGETATWTLTLANASGQWVMYEMEQQ